MMLQDGNSHCYTRVSLLHTRVLCYLCHLLAGEEPHDVPVPRENTELHQIPEH